MPMRVVVVVVVAGILGVFAGCARPAQPSHLLQPLAVDWASYFTVEWQATPQDGRALVSGKVTNTTGWGARRIQLLVEGVDPTGQVVSQRVVWLGVDLPSTSHAFFEVPVVPTSTSYRVQVFAFDTGRRK
jgi:hypothetical protein